MGCTSSAQKRILGDENHNVKTKIKIRNGDISKDYLIDNTKVLGTGWSGPVKQAQNITSKKRVALKSFNKAGLSKEKLDFLKSEVTIYLKLDHPHIVRLLDVYENARHVHLVMELCTGRELYHRLVEQKRYTEKDAADTTYQMLLAIQYLHSHHIAHRDLKLENWLYQDEAPKSRLKLIDFGFSRFWEVNTYMKQTCGSAAYVAPEVLHRKYTTQCDMWSLGVIVFMLLSGQPPFFGSEDEMMLNIQKGAYVMKPSRWSSVTDTAKDFVRNLLVTESFERFAASEALSHPWIKNRAQQPQIQISKAVLDDMRNFAISSHFKRAALTMMAYSLSSSEIADVHDIFIAMDTSEKGTISLPGLRDLMLENMEISNAEIEMIFKSLDPEHEGEISYTEFVASMLQHRIRVNEEVIKDAFSKFDQEGKGSISANSLRQVLGDSFEGVDVQDILAQVDKTGDGCIDYERFLQLIQSNSPAARMSKRFSIDDQKQAFNQLLKSTASVVDMMRTSSCRGADELGLHVSVVLKSTAQTPMSFRSFGHNRAKSDVDSLSSLGVSPMKRDCSRSPIGFHLEDPHDKSSI